MRFELTANHKLDRSINRSIRDQLTAAVGRSRCWLAAPRHRALSRCPPTRCVRECRCLLAHSRLALCVCAVRVNRRIATRADSDRTDRSSRDPSAWLRAATSMRLPLARMVIVVAAGGSERAGRRRSAAVCVADAGLLESRSTSSRMMDAPQRARPTRQRDWRLREGLRSRGESASPSALLSR